MLPQSISGPHCRPMGDVVNPPFISAKPVERATFFPIIIHFIDTELCITFFIRSRSFFWKNMAMNTTHISYSMQMTRRKNLPSGDNNQFQLMAISLHIKGRCDLECVERWQIGEEKWIGGLDRQFLFLLLKKKEMLYILSSLSVSRRERQRRG